MRNFELGLLKEKAKCYRIGATLASFVQYPFVVALHLFFHILQ